jgi:hypothetical protein
VAMLGLAVKTYNKMKTIIGQNELKNLLFCQDILNTSQVTDDQGKEKRTLIRVCEFK